MWCKNVRTTFFRFVTNHVFERQTNGQTDRWTAFSWLDHIACSAYSAVNMCSNNPQTSHFCRPIRGLGRSSLKVKLVKQDAQLSQRDRAAGCVIVFAKSRTLERGDNDLRIL